VLAALEAAPAGLTVPQLLAEVNVSQGRIEKALELLSLESPAPIAKQGTRWQLTAARLGESFWERAERLTDLRRREQRQMQEYIDLSAGHMEFLIRALDGEPGDLSAPDLPPLPATPDPGLVREAILFLKRTSLPIEPRKRWPAGGLPRFGVTGKVAEDLQVMPGKALCLWADAAWGALVRRGKYEDGRFSDELVDACVELLEEWRPDPAPAWVTCVPSRRHPNLVPDFAGRLADALGLPFESVLVRVDDRPEQKRMANSTQQARNLDGALAWVGEEPLPGPVLLVDDMVDSRWTFTVSAWLLRSNGCGEVWPLALSQAGSGS
jgi:ATP-dependent DNA helicase RecQ